MKQRTLAAIYVVALSATSAAAGLFPGEKFPVGDSPRALAVGDFDGDGQQDLVTANTSSDEVTVLLNQGERTITAVLDIKPDSLPNTINPHSRGVIPVAVLGSETFDVAYVDVTTLAFGPGGAPTAHLNGHPQDVNHDGITDLLTHYRTRNTGIVCGDESVTLTGETLGGQPFEGTDSIVTVGCRRSERPSLWMKDQRRVVQPRGEAVIDLERK